MHFPSFVRTSPPEPFCVRHSLIFSERLKISLMAMPLWCSFSFIETDSVLYIIYLPIARLDRFMVVATPSGHK